MLFRYSDITSFTSAILTHHLGGGFKYFFIFTSISGRFPILRAYFSDGLEGHHQPVILGGILDPPGFLCGGGSPSPEDYVGLTHNNLQIDNVRSPWSRDDKIGIYFSGCLERFFFKGTRSCFFGGTDGVLGKKNIC